MIRVPTFGPRRGYVVTPRRERDCFLVLNLLFSSTLFLFARRCRLIDTSLARYDTSYLLHKMAKKNNATSISTKYHPHNLLCPLVTLYGRNYSRRIKESAQCWRNASVVQGHVDIVTDLLVTYRNSLDKKTKTRASRRLVGHRRGRYRCRSYSCS